MISTISLISSPGKGISDLENCYFLQAHLKSRSLGKELTHLVKIQADSLETDCHLYQGKHGKVGPSQSHRYSLGKLTHFFSVQADRMHWNPFHVKTAIYRKTEVHLKIT